MVRGTMIVATAAWAAGEALRNRSPRADRWARAIWTVGITFALLHVALAFHLIYAWDHDAAVAATARQTADLTLEIVNRHGLRCGGPRDLHWRHRPRV